MRGSKARRHDGAPSGWRASFSRVLERIGGALAAFERRIAALSMIVIVLAIGVTIAARLMNLALPSFGEIAIVAMSPLTFLGGALCTHLRQHITIDVVDLMRDGPVKTVLTLGASVAVAVFAGVFTWLAWDLFSYALASGERLIDLGTPIWIPMGCIVLGAALICLHAIIDVVHITIGRTEATA